MTISPMSEFLENIRRATLRRDEAGWTDGQLLDAYLRGREEAVFAALVHRHGPMVWGVCRRILGNEGDAEDAFQATFLVLVRKAASIKPREKVANWLYGVAQKTAVKARAMAVKRKMREKQVKDMPEAVVVEQTDADDLLPLLDRELSRLPDKYRSALVLCELEGRSYREAAGQLGCPEGTLAARLTRGRAMLAKRLARHGRAVTGAALATVFASRAPAGVPASVVSSTIEAADLFAAGQAAVTGAIAPSVAALTEGVLKTMLLSKLKIAMAVFLGVALTSIGIGRCLCPLKGADSVSERQERKEENASTPSPKKTVSDKEKLQGTWKVLVDEAQKQKQLFAVDEYKLSKFIIDGEQFVWELKSKKVKGNVRLNEKEKTFLLTYEGDGIEGKYQIKGNTVAFRGTIAYVKNKVLPPGPPNPIVLEREPPSEKSEEKETREQRPKDPPAENILQNGGFEEGDESPAHWSQGAEIDGVQYIWDKEHGKRGKASLCLHKTAQRYFPIAQWYQIVDRKGDKPTLRVSAQVKAEGVTKAIVDVIFLDEQGDSLGHRWVSYIGAKQANDPPVSHDWKEYTGRVEIPPAAKKIQVALQIYGPGKVWFDEVRAQYEAGRPAQAEANEEESNGEKQPLEGRTRGNAKLQSLLKERVDLLRANVERAKRLHEQHVADLDTVRQANLRLYKAELDLFESPKDRIAVLEKIVAVYKEMEDHISQLRKQSVAGQDAVDDAKLNRLEAEIALEREKSKLAPLSK